MTDSAPDAAAARRAFERAARRPQQCFLVREAARRMEQRLDYVTLEPKHVLDAGCGPGADLAPLNRRYPRAEVIGVDSACGQLRAARGQRTIAERARALLGGRAARLVCADLARLPLADGSMGLVWSNIALPWAPQPAAAFSELARVLEPRGLFTFSTYGPDTLKELRQAFSVADANIRLHSFSDMHDLGDLLVASGFAQPVMDMEKLIITYTSVDALLADLRGSGQTNVASARTRGLTGRGAWQRMTDACEKLRRDGRIAMTVELVFGHAWKPGHRRGEGVAPIRFHR